MFGDTGSWRANQTMSEIPMFCTFCCSGDTVITMMLATDNYYEVCWLAIVFFINDIPASCWNNPFSLDFFELRRRNLGLVLGLFILGLTSVLRLYTYIYTYKSCLAHTHIYIIKNNYARKPCVSLSLKTSCFNVQPCISWRQKLFLSHVHAEETAFYLATNESEHVHVAWQAQGFGTFGKIPSSFSMAGAWDSRRFWFFGGCHFSFFSGHGSVVFLWTVSAWRIFLLFFMLCCVIFVLGGWVWGGWMRWVGGGVGR